MPIYFTFIGRVLSVTGVGGFKAAKVSHEDGEGIIHEVAIKYFQSSENALYPDRVYLFNGTVIFIAGKAPVYSLIRNTELFHNTPIDKSIANDAYCTSTVTMLSDLVKMPDTSLSHFQGQMYQYNSEAREDVVCTVTFLIDTKVPLFAKLVTYLQSGKTLDIAFKYIYETDIDRAYAFSLAISFSRDLVPKEDKASIFQTPKSKRKVLLGPLTASTSPIKTIKPDPDSSMTSPFSSPNSIRSSRNLFSSFQKKQPVSNSDGDSGGIETPSTPANSLIIPATEASGSNDHGFEEIDMLETSEDDEDELGLADSTSKKKYHNTKKAKGKGKA